MNTLQIEGTLLEKQEVRYTPAGIEVFEGILQYTGEQLEAGSLRKLSFEVKLVSFGETAHRLNAEALGKTLKITGFLAPRYMRGNNLIVHIKEYI